MKASYVLRMVSAGLQDLEEGQDKRWEWKEGDDSSIGLLDFMNIAIRAVAMQRPDCYPITEVIYLEPGMLQQIPKVLVHGSTLNAVALCELVRNMGRDGRTPGNPILSAHKDTTLAWTNPHTTRERTYPREIDNFMYDRATNKDYYYVYPPVPTDARTNRVYVECTYYAQPPMITRITDDIGIPDAYSMAIAHHMLASIMSIDNESSGLQKADYHLKVFQQLMDMQLQVDMGLPKSKNSLGA